MKQDNLIHPPPPVMTAAEAESPESWGFRDTRFAFTEDGVVTMLGNRYELSGKKLARLLPWICEVLQVEVDPRDLHRSSYPTAIPEAIESKPFLEAISVFLQPDQLDRDGEVRLRHGHGQTQEEVFAIKYACLGRIPDLTVHPHSDEQVAKLVEAAKEHNVVLIPFGGGTNVTDALRCPEGERRMIVSADMRRMNRIRWIDKENMMACIEAGAVGRHLVAQLAEHGLTMGHEPDSVEFSTLGGWIATNASGMKKNRYGNIEDLVVDLSVATADGRLAHLNTAPRESIGSDLRRLIFGSEGTLGIITSAVVKLFPLPEVQKYGSIIFPSYEDGYRFMRDMAHAGAIPASVRLVDNLQFQFGQTLKPAAQGLAAWKSRLEKFFVLSVKGFNPGRMVALTLVFEGTRNEVARQQREVYHIAAGHGGMNAGSENGRRGYQLTYSIAYIRDFLLNYYIIAESFETSCAWSDALAIDANVKRILYAEYEKRGLPGKPFITSRITQVYRTGVAIYFYFGFYYKGVENPSQVYLELETIARHEILRWGGSLSHHHGVGKIRRAFLPEIMSQTGLKWKQEIKRGLDPQNIFGAGNQNL